MPTGRGLRLGRVMGIELNLDFSWLILSMVMTWSLSGLFAEAVPALGRSVHVLMGIVGAVLFFISIVAHEMAHSLMARRKGLEVQSITLFVFGGVARINKDAETPGDEFMIAVVGPIVSVLLGAMFFGMGILGEAAGILMAAALFQTLGVINGALAIFNLIPGFPMDGGRILRAAIWKKTSDMLRATRIAALGGKTVAIGLVAGGIYQIFMTEDFVGGVWWILLGMFLSQAATQSYQQVRLKSSIVGLTVQDLMTKDPETVAGNVTLMDAVNERFLLTGMSSFPVVGPDGLPEGILTLEAIRGQPRETWDQLVVRRVMIPLSPSIEAQPREPLPAILERLADNPIGRFLVIDEGRLVGILSATDIARYMRVAEMVG